MIGNFDPSDQQIKPADNSYYVGPLTAEFDMSQRELHHCDSVDNNRSPRELIQRILSTVEPD